MSRLFGVSCDWLLNYDGVLPKTAQEEKNGVFTFDLNSLHFEYKSKAHWGKLPLVHINIGIGRVAKGVFALGLVSTGLVSVGVLSFGLLAFGSICLGLLAFGGAALGIIALGGLAIGLFSMGGGAIGLFACGGYALGAFVAVGDVAVGGIAFGDTSAHGSALSVLISEYEGMKEVIAQKFEEIPKIWSVFTAWSRSLADFFMKT